LYNGIKLIDDKGIFLIRGMSKNIRLYRNNNYILDKNSSLLKYQISNYISDNIFTSK
jgi:hypothetical protein